MNKPIFEKDLCNHRCPYKLSKNFSIGSVEYLQVQCIAYSKPLALCSEKDKECRCDECIEEFGEEQ